MKVEKPIIMFFAEHLQTIHKSASFPFMPYSLSKWKFFVVVSVHWEFKFNFYVWTEKYIFYGYSLDFCEALESYLEIILFLKISKIRIYHLEFLS